MSLTKKLLTDLLEKIEGLHKFTVNRVSDLTEPNITSLIRLCKAVAEFRKYAEFKIKMHLQSLEAVAEVAEKIKELKKNG
jgi:hypothetical protein